MRWQSQGMVVSLYYNIWYHYLHGPHRPLFYTIHTV